MAYIYVYTNKYFTEKNSVKIGSTLNPYIRLNTYTTYYIDKGYFEYIFEIDKDPYVIDSKIRTEYISDLNTRINGELGGTEIYKNINIYERIIKCFENENIKWIEIDPKNPPFTKKYDETEQFEYKKYIKNTLKTKLEIYEPFEFDIEYERINILSIDGENNNNINEKINSIINSDNKNNSMVRLNGEYVNDPEIRNSYSYEITIDFKSLFGIDHLGDIKQLLKSIIGINNHKNIIWNNENNYVLLEYIKGGFFTKHRDKKINNKHYGTLLIFPPAIKQYEHVGGDLIIYNLDGTKFIFESSKNKKWTFIAFHTYLQHECTEVISGRRIVFKKELLLKNQIKKQKFIKFPTNCED